MSEAEEINNAVVMLNDIQRLALRGRVTQNDRATWDRCARFVKERGYRLSKTTKKNGWGCTVRVTWSAVPRRPHTRHFAAEWVKFAPVSADHANQCTTRGMFFLFDGTVPYCDIREEQNRRAREVFGRGVCWGWNHATVWGAMLEERGYVKVTFRKTIRRDLLAAKLSDCGRILTRSFRHVAGICGGRVYDSWNSLHGRCTELYCRREVEDRVRELLALWC